MHQLQSDHMQAWKEHYELLLGLCRYQDAAALRSRALAGNPGTEERFPLPEQSAQAASDEIGDVGQPFVQRKEQDRKLDMYLGLFQGREDCFARQWADKNEGKQGYVPVRRSLTREDVLDHLHMRRTYGMYLLQAASLVNLGVIDVDVVQNLRRSRLTSAVRSQVRKERDYLMSRLPEISEGLGLFPLAEFSGGKGYHFWFFFDPPVPAKQVRNVLAMVVTG